MTTTCPHCSIQIEIDHETLASLQGHAHFSCPSCSGLVEVPHFNTPRPVAPVRAAAAAAIRPPATLRPSAWWSHEMERSLRIRPTMAESDDRVFGRMGRLVGQRSLPLFYALHNSRSESKCGAIICGADSNFSWRKNLRKFPFLASHSLGFNQACHENFHLSRHRLVLPRDSPSRSRDSGPFIVLMDHRRL